MKEAAAKTPPKPAVLSLAQLLTEQPAAPPPGWIEPGLLPPEGILFVGGEPKVGKSLLVANLALALAAGKDRAGFPIPAARRVLVCQFELPTPQFVGRLAIDAPHPGSRRRSQPAGGHARRRQSAQRAAGTESLSQRRPSGRRRGDRARPAVLHPRSGRKRYALDGGAVPEPAAAARCFQSGAHRRASRSQIDRPRRDRQRLPRLLGAARRGRLATCCSRALRPHLSATVELRFQFRYAAPPQPRLLELDPAHVVVFRRRPGALQGCRRAQKGGTGAT